MGNCPPEGPGKPKLRGIGQDWHDHYVGEKLPTLRGGFRKLVAAGSSQENGEEGGHQSGRLLLDCSMVLSSENG